MHLDLSLSLAGALVGLLVGLTGMGGGALLTPLLVLVFHVPALAAISSDLVTSLLMKPVGAAVHLRRRTVHKGVVRWLAIGAVPAALTGAVLIGGIGQVPGVQGRIKVVIAVVLLASLASTTVRQVVDRQRGERCTEDGVVVRPGRTVAIGAFGGLAVGTTSVGAGSLVMALLLVAYPRLRPSQLVGTDMVQAIPLVAAAALGHVLFGDVHLAVTASLLLGALPAVYVGARLSSQAPAALIRSILAGVLLASALALLQVTPLLLAAGALTGIAATAMLSFGASPDQPCTLGPAEVSVKRSRQRRSRSIAAR